MVNYFKGSFVGMLFNRLSAGVVKLKTLFSKTVFGITGSAIALCLFAVVYFDTVNADELPIGNSVAVASDKTPEDRLENLLLEMGYTDVDVNACVLQFRRDLPNQCPTDKSLSYWRSIDLRNLDVEGIGEVESRGADGNIWYLFKVPPSPYYYSQSIKISSFVRELKEELPNTVWRFRFDETTPQIRDSFYSEFPRATNMNWWISETCYGESPYFDVDSKFSFNDRDLLSQFRAALIDYNTDSICTSEDSS